MHVTFPIDCNPKWGIVVFILVQYTRLCSHVLDIWRTWVRDQRDHRVDGGVYAAFGVRAVRELDLSRPSNNAIVVRDHNVITVSSLGDAAQ